MLSMADYDISGCLINCSNHGSCVFDQTLNKISCACDEFYQGASCETDIRPCSSSPCLNGAICEDLITDNSSSFFCLCADLYEGISCENRINVCFNETCSNHGNCLDVHGNATCKCFSGYQGEFCEIESASLKAVRRVIKATSVIAILCIILFYTIIILMDLHRIFFIEKRRLLRRQPRYSQFQNDERNFKEENFCENTNEVNNNNLENENEPRNIRIETEKNDRFHIAKQYNLRMMERAAEMAQEENKLEKTQSADFQTKRKAEENTTEKKDRFNLGKQYEQRLKEAASAVTTIET